MDIVAATEADIPEIQAIYAHHVLHGAGTFEETPPSIEDMTARFHAIAARGWSYLVARDETGVVGYGYYAQFRDRSALPVLRRGQHLRPQRRARPGRGQGPRQPPVDRRRGRAGSAR